MIGNQQRLAQLLVMCMLYGYSHLILADTEVITINYRSGEEMLQVVTPLLTNDEHASSMGNQLIVNASPLRIQEIRDLVQQLDTKSKQYLLHITKGRELLKQDTKLAVDAQFKKNSATTLSNLPPQQISLYFERDQLYLDQNQMQDIRATEGYWTTLTIRQENHSPINNKNFSDKHFDDKKRYPLTHVEHVDKSLKSLQLLVRSITGNNIEITVSDTDANLTLGNTNAMYGTGTNSTQLDTKISSQIGKWAPLGGITYASQKEITAIGEYSNHNESSQTQWFIMVEALN